MGAIALMTSACGGGESEHGATEATTASTGPDPALVAVPTTGGDGYDHVVVLTENAPTGGTGDEVQETEPDVTGPEVIEPDVTEPDTPRPGTTLPVSTVAPVAEVTVTTDAAAASLAPSTVVATVTTDGAASPAGAIRTEIASGTPDVLVTRADGTSEPEMIPDGSLQTERVLTQAEFDLLASFADQPLSVLVQDVDGVVGEPGRRYVMIPGRLIEVAGQRASTTATTTPVTVDGPENDGPENDGPENGDSEVSGPENTDPENTGPEKETATTEPADTERPVIGGPPSKPPTDDELLAVLVELPGVVSAEIVAPGVIAVVLTGDREDLERVPGVVSVEDDTLFDLAAVSDEGEQSMHSNSGSSSPAGGGRAQLPGTTRPLS